MTDSKVVAFIDVGTNSIHVLVSKFYPDSLGTPIYHDKESVRLGQNLFSQGFIDEETVKRSHLVISNFVKVAKDMGAEEIFAYATSAAREAYNRSEILDAASGAGLDLKIISGKEEARLAGLGVFGPYGPSDRCLLFDLGGGSTEINLSKGTEVLYLDSLMAGSVRFSFGIGIDQHDRVKKADYDLMRKEVRKLAKKAVKKVKGIGFDRAMGSSGTLVNLAEMCAARRGDGDSSYMTLKELSHLMADLCDMTEFQRRSVPKINIGRSDIIIGGGAIAEEIMRLFEVDIMYLSDRGLREGMQVEYLLESGSKVFNLRSSSVNNLARRCNTNLTHSGQVRAVALRLFDGFKREGIHEMDDKDRSILGYASILHDIGEFISYNRHNVHTYTIITNSNMPGFNSDELEDMALIARFHHKKFPSRNNRYLRYMDSERVEKIRMSALFLRVADVLDRHRSSNVEEMGGKVKKNSFIITLTSEEDLNMEVWKLQELSEAFEDVLGLKLRICASGWGETINVPEKETRKAS